MKHNYIVRFPWGNKNGAIARFAVELINRDIRFDFTNEFIIKNIKVSDHVLQQEIFKLVCAEKASLGIENEGPAGILILNGRSVSSLLWPFEPAGTLAIAS